MPSANARLSAQWLKLAEGSLLLERGRGLLEGRALLPSFSPAHTALGLGFPRKSGVQGSRLGAMCRPQAAREDWRAGLAPGRHGRLQAAWEPPHLPPMFVSRGFSHTPLCFERSSLLNHARLCYSLLPVFGLRCGGINIMR